MENKSSPNENVETRHGEPLSVAKTPPPAQTPAPSKSPDPANPPSPNSKIENLPSDLPAEASAKEGQKSQPEADPPREEKIELPAVSKAELPHQPSDIKPDEINEPEQEPPEIIITERDHAHLSEDEKVPRPDAVYKDPALVAEAEKNPIPNIKGKGVVKFPKPAALPQPQPSRVPIAEKLATALDRRLKQLLINANRERKNRVQMNLDAILEFALKSDIITNNDVEYLTNVSDAQARRYLNKLVRQGKLVRYGRYKNTYYKHVSKAK